MWHVYKQLVTAVYRVYHVPLMFLLKGTVPAGCKHPVAPKLRYIENLSILYKHCITEILHSYNALGSH